MGHSYENGDGMEPVARLRLSGWKSWSSRPPKKAVKKRRPCKTKAERIRWEILLELERKHKAARTMLEREAIEAEMREINKSGDVRPTICKLWVGPERDER